jgi:predicted outer membrane repeat protein
MKGGGLYLFNNIKFQLEKVYFANNTADFSGGAIFSNTNMQSVLKEVRAT